MICVIYCSGIFFNIFHIRPMFNMYMFITYTYISTMRIQSVFTTLIIQARGS